MYVVYIYIYIEAMISSNRNIYTYIYIYMHIYMLYVQYIKNSICCILCSYDEYQLINHLTIYSVVSVVRAKMLLNHLCDETNSWVGSVFKF